MASEMTVQAARSEPIPGERSVLVVEDNAQLRQVTVGYLSSLDLDVAEAEDAHAAIAMLDAGARFDVVFSDVVMPGMTGGELARRLCPVRPEMRVLFMSGYADDVIVRKGVLEEGVARIQKPMSPDTLGAKVRETLGRSAPAMISAK